MSRKNDGFDQNIIAALLRLRTPLFTAHGSEVSFDKNKRNETIYEHIAHKKHHLTIKDIAAIPAILADRKSLKKDRNGKRYRTYIGKRGKKKERIKYLKIVTEVGDGNKESIVAIYLTKNKD